MNFAEGTKLTERVNLLIGNFSWSRLYRVEYLVERVIPGLKIIVAVNETVCMYWLVGLLPILVENQIYKLFQAYNRYFTVIVLSTVSRNCTTKRPLFFTGTVMLACDTVFLAPLFYSTFQFQTNS